ncbi:MAG TPA: hypothetical protein VFZ09_08525 [Archangium sp.]|uniref:hypothetical protein n=1 Tax=Archangium sp. TaxID=1872627 RepID=UPI002E33F867|nr:hypothetical protein [Archangium sp.]HEX5746275.1 hypothetical protein [Archangium sp.]
MSAPTKPYVSRYGGLWPDLHNADELLAERRKRGMVSDEDAEMLRQWREKGYVQISNAVPASVLDEILAEQDRAWQTADSSYRVQTGHSDFVRPRPDIRYQTGCRLLDVYAKFDAACAAIFSRKITHFLRLLFDRDVFKTQTAKTPSASRCTAGSSGCPGARRLRA